MKILEIQDVIKYYGTSKNVTKALDNISFSMEEGEFTVIMGASGSGKSTMLNVISTIDSPSSGTLQIQGKNVEKMKEKDLATFRRDRLGFIFQEYNLIDTLTIRENIIMPLNLKKMGIAESERRLQDVVSKMGIKDQLNKFPKDLSGGQRQRAACARALITHPALILADEPTGALDSANSKNLMETFTMMNEELGSTILMVTHDAMMGSYASRILFLKDGRIWNELIRGERPRNVMYQEILNTMAVLGGEANAR